MPELWTPTQTHQERERAVEYSLQKHLAEAKALEKELKELDEHLTVVWIGDRAPEFPGVTPGRWHVRRANPGAPNSFMPIVGPKGEYLEPSFRIVEELKANDLWNDDAMRTLMKKHSQRAEERAKTDALMSEQSREETAHLYKAAKRVAGDGGMTRPTWGKS